MRPVAMLAVALAIAPACLGAGATKSLQADVDDIQAQLLILQKEHADLRGQLGAQAEALRQALAQCGEGQRMEMADLGVRLESLSREMEVLVQKLEDTNYRLSGVSAEIQAARAAVERLGAGAVPAPVPPGEAAPGDAAPPAAPDVSVGGPSPEEIFNTAYADYTKGNYPLAILGFQEYLERFPGSAFADDAQYWVGESYYSQGKFADAVQALGEVVRRYPQGDKVPAARLKRGLAHLEANQTAQGVVELNALIETYPGSDEARLARERLRSLGLQER